MSEFIKTRKSERGFSSIGTMALSIFALLSSTMLINKIVDIKKAKKNEANTDANRRVNEAALQIVVQLVGTGSIFYDPKSCGGIIRPQTKFSGGSEVGHFSCKATSKESLNEFDCESASSDGWRYRNTGSRAVVDVCVPVSEKSSDVQISGKESSELKTSSMRKKVPVSVTFLEYRSEKFQRDDAASSHSNSEDSFRSGGTVVRHLAAVRARRISSNKKYPTLDGEVNLGAAEDANNGLIGKHGASDTCFFMRPRTVEQGVSASVNDSGGGRRKYLSFASRKTITDSTYESYTYSDLEPRPDGKLADQFGRDYSWEEISLGAVREDGTRPTRAELAPFFSHLRELGERIYSQYEAGKRIGRRMGHNLGSKPVSASLDLKTETIDGTTESTLVVGHYDYLDRKGTYRNFFAGVMPQSENGEGPNFRWFLHENHDTKARQWPSRSEFDRSERAGMKGGCATSGADRSGRYDFCTRVDIPHQRHDVRIRKKCRRNQVTLNAGDAPQFSNRAVNVSCSSVWVEKVGKVYRGSVDTGSSDGDVVSDQKIEGYKYSGKLKKENLIYEVSMDQLVSALEVDDSFQNAIDQIASGSDSMDVVKWAGQNSAKRGSRAPLVLLKTAYDEVSLDGVRVGHQQRFDPPPNPSLGAMPPSPKTYVYYTYEDTTPVVAQHTSQTCSYFYYEKPDRQNQCNFTYKTELNNDFVCRSNDGCFDESTTIRMADASDRKITLLKKGEYVFNPVTGKPSRITKLVIGPEDKPLVHITVNGRQVKVTGTHPFMTRGGWVRAKMIKQGDLVMDSGRIFVPVTAVGMGESGRVVVNLALEGSANEADLHYVLANGVVTGDLVIQNMIDSRASSR